MFDQGAFTPGAPDFTGGTPPPDFSPDTGLQAEPPTPGPVGAPPAKGGRPIGTIVTLAALVIALFGGMALAPYVLDYLPFLPNEPAQEIQRFESQAQQLQREINNLQQGGPSKPSPEDERLAQEMAEVSEALKSARTQLDRASTDLEEATQELDAIETQLESTGQNYVTAEGMLEELKSETTILEARQKGLIAEVARLNNTVASLEEANKRRVAAKAALVHNIDRLVIQVKESLPLTPERYSHAERLAEVQELRALADEAQWVTPALQDAYNELSQKELAIADETIYFFARLKVENEFGVHERKWCECLMLGNWRVYFRSLDGKNIGTYENLSTEQTPIWGVRQGYAKDVMLRIEDAIVAARTPDYESKIAVLAEKELAVDQRTPLQRHFDSLL